MVSSVIKVCPNPEELSVVRVNIPCPVYGCSSILPHAGSLRIHLSKTHRITERSDKNDLDNNCSDNHSQNVVKQYHCPVQSCVYNVSSKRHFASKKLLKQHYMKVHADKKHKCPKCGQGFGLDRDCRRHFATCGMIFRCKTCDCPFSSAEATINHCNLKQHEIPVECKNIRSGKTTPVSVAPTFIILHTSPSALTSQSAKTVTPTTFTSQLRPLLPKPVIKTTLLSRSEPLVMSGDGTSSFTHLLNPGLNKTHLTESNNVCIQTENQLDNTMMSYPTLENHLYKRTNWQETNDQTDSTLFAGINQKSVKRLSEDAIYSLNKFTSSTGIQTAVSVPPVKKKSLHNMVGTQTMGDYILTTAMSSAQIPIQQVSQASQANSHCKVAKNQNTESSHTQTMDVKSSKWKKRRHSFSWQENLDEIQIHENTQNLLLFKDTGSTSELTDNHTQTISESVPAISTQTNMTCLMNSWQNGKVASDNNTSFNSQQSTETQTISSVLQKMMNKNEDSFYQLATPYNEESSTEQSSFPPIDSDNSKAALPNTINSSLQTNTAMDLLYSPLSRDTDSTINRQVSSDNYQAFNSELTPALDDSNCASLLNSIADQNASDNYICENEEMQSNVVNNESVESIRNKNEISESSSAISFSFINQSLDTNECSLSSFSSSRQHHGALASFSNLQNINQESEDNQRNNQENATNLLNSLVDKDPILYSSTSFADIGDSSDALKYPQMESFDNVQAFTTSTTPPLDITDASLLSFDKRLNTTNRNNNTDNYLIQPESAKNKNKISQNSDIGNISNKSFFDSSLENGMAGNNETQSEKIYFDSTKNAEINFPSGEFYLSNPNVSPVQCNQSLSEKLFSSEKGVGTDSCINHYTDISSTASSFYNTTNDVLNDAENKDSSTSMNDVIEDARNRISMSSLSSAECNPMISREFPPMVANSEVQTLALDDNIEALLNNSEHSRSSSVIDMHTQTVEDILDLFGNNMETQTAVDDTFLLGLEFSDIETQTTAGDLDSVESRCLITAGTQTTFSNLNLSQDVEFSDMETQTGFTMMDLDTFLTDSHTQTTFGELEDFLCGFNS
ncbi:ATM interactor-like [Octopus vulgaris]|uniref:ATM interactor-like n=1 Tax=Octopus vulgaris TaxID=6645 RepID=A0AA36EX74_OCTVU|nr:ATM interactor-like [Octopus vulgaris]